MSRTITSFFTARILHRLRTCTTYPAGKTLKKRSDMPGLGWMEGTVRKNIGGFEWKACSRCLFRHAAEFAQRLCTTSQHEGGETRSHLQSIWPA